ncbi:hypothetical protein [Bradyrhizobium sp. 150]|uniref:hypothetical protein n=1 Tax=Bradyrhizobium sp. 150 TaxID=2782625 RepID=UPI001FF93B39|nr:hypothetical protein [Bradyrhizobium sp. 150]MCK1672798.1 hypothetical protein [Bradyrhizobium sp. 150]
MSALAELEEEVAEFALDAAERKPGAADKLATHRAKIEGAKTAVGELRAALNLAAKLDRQAEASAAIQMRDEQLQEFKLWLGQREAGMKVALEGAAMMARGYAEFANASLLAAGIVPSGTRVPTMSFGRDGMFGAAFGTAERLFQAELFRTAPEVGGRRYVLPFAKAPTMDTVNDPRSITPGLVALREADAAIVMEIEAQVARLSDEAFAAASANDVKAA